MKSILGLIIAFSAAQLTGALAHAGLTVEFQGAPPNMAACLPGNEEKFTGLAGYAVSYDLSDHDPKEYEFRVFTKEGKEVDTSDVQINIPGLIMTGNKVDLRQYMGRGSFSAQLLAKPKLVCTNFELNMKQIQLKAVPIK